MSQIEPFNQLNFSYFSTLISTMKAKATLKQIAKELNVSVSTVSKALNDSLKLANKPKQK